MSESNQQDFIAPDGSIAGMVHRDPWQTEVEAAYAVLPHLSTLRARIYSAFMERPQGMTDMELDTLPEFANLAETTASKRRTELFQMGALKPVGKRRNANGRTAIVWAISPSEFRKPALASKPISRATCPHCGQVIREFFNQQESRS